MASLLILALPPQIVVVKSILVMCQVSTTDDVVDAINAVLFFSGTEFVMVKNRSHPYKFERSHEVAQMYHQNTHFCAWLWHNWTLVVKVHSVLR